MSSTAIRGSNMELRYHGGSCCGIKTICGLGFADYNYGAGPLGEAVKVEAPYKMEPAHVGKGNNNSLDHLYQGKEFFHGNAPEETRLERLDRYLDFCRKTRPGGLVEIVLASHSGDPDYNQLRGPWPKLLRERGFRAVTSFVNSNSKNKCVVYHLKMVKAEG